MNVRDAITADLTQFPSLALASWKGFQSIMEPVYWEELVTGISNPSLYSGLLEKAAGLVCEAPDGTLAGMGFLVPSGNPTNIYPGDWSYIRMLSVHPDYIGNGIGRRLTEGLISLARERREKIISLHTSEMMNAARNIYGSLGFAIVRELEPRFGKRYWLYRMDINK